MSGLKLTILVLWCAGYVFGDLYMHNPRGSNDRLNEQNTNRNNGNRLFDSQNNAKGGYAIGPPMTFYEGSLLDIKWTAQHGCGNPKLECNMVIQYMCGLTNEPDQTIQIRDGQTTNTIPDDENYNQKEDNGEYTYGMHESRSYYTACKTRRRNAGLFIADRNVGNSARNTRQNNNGDRRGFECPEERDYYPYWHSSPWRDVAVLVDNDDNCDLFKKESQNVKEKGYCAARDSDEPQPENNPQECQVAGKEWKKSPSWGLSAPECKVSDFSRENHLGNVPGANTASYKWVLPKKGDVPCLDEGDDGECICVLRLRYNISTTDVDGWGFDDASKNAANSPITNDPNVPVGTKGSSVSLAIDTSQFARTFQDRSHTFYLKRRPKSVSQSAHIFNLNVQGKRGNIVQTYPAVEYDFAPNNLEVKVGDYIHFQWTGSDKNPQGNAGEGTDQTDRSNIVQLSTPNSMYPASEEWLSKNDRLFDQETAEKFALLGQTDCLSYEQLKEKNNNNQNNIEQDVQNCMKLNAAPTPYFDGGLIQQKKQGAFYFMSSRNNNFSNRDQRGVIYVIPLLPTWAIAIVVVGSVIFLGSGALGAAMFYAKTHPHSSIANTLSKLTN